MMNRLLVILVVVLFAVSEYALAQNRVPAIRKPIEVVQPDGDTLTIRLWGDEHKHYRTTEDGYVILQDARGYYCYARLRKGEQVASRRKAHDEAKRSRCEMRYLRRKGLTK